MSEITVGTWNALNSFGDERASEALEVVKRMDADVLAIQEFTSREGQESDYRWQTADALYELGYEGLVSDYSPDPTVRNEHTMSIWSRQGGHFLQPQLGKRYGLQVKLPGNLPDVYGVHFDDLYEESRIESAEALLEHWRKTTRHGDVVVAGDWNAIHHHDPKSRLPRALGRVIGRFDVDDYYDDSRKWQRLGGKILRVCRMADGRTLQLFTERDFRDADPTYQPTIGAGRLALQLDHIVANVELENFTVHPRSVNQDGRPLSDHSPITVLVQSS